MKFKKRCKKKNINNRIDELEQKVSKLRVQLEALELKNFSNNNNNNTIRRLKNNNKIEIGDYVKSTNKPWQEGIISKFGTKNYWVFIEIKDGEKRKALTNVTKFYS